MDENITEKFLSCYNDEILNWLSNMSDDDKANFLFHLEKYGKENLNDDITLNKLKNGEYMSHLISEKEANYKCMKSHFVYDGIFLSLSGINAVNFQKYIELMSKDDEVVKQILLTILYVLPPAALVTCTFMMLHYWYHYSLCNNTTETYQRQLKKN